MKKSKKNLGGRPKKPDMERRTSKLDFVRVSKAEREYIAKQAAKAAVSDVKWVRQRLGLESTGYGE